MINKCITICLGLLTFFGMVLLPEACLTAASEGLELCVKVIIPSLFPFFVCSKLLIKSGVARKMGEFFSPIMRPLFNVPGSGSFAFFLGILSGYPVGAKCAADLYENKLCTKAEAERLVCFCNNSGPLFIIGSVAVGMLLNKTAGIYLYIAHVLSAITIGLLFRFYKREERGLPHTAPVQPKPQSIGEIFSSAMSEAVQLVLYVCGFVIFFSVFLITLSKCGVGDMFTAAARFFGASDQMATALFYSFFEMVNGLKKVCMLDIGELKLVLVSMVIGWGGISVMLQVFGVTSDCGFSKKAFIGAKALQSVFAGLYTLLLLSLPFGEVPVLSQSYAYIPTSAVWAYSLILMISSVILFLFLSIAVLLVKIVKKL